MPTSRHRLSNSMLVFIAGTLGAFLFGIGLFAFLIEVTAGGLTEPTRLLAAAAVGLGGLFIYIAWVTFDTQGVG